MVQILSLHPSLEYNVHFPVVRGDLHLHRGLGGSVSAVLADLETIWGHCISTILNVPLKDLKVGDCRYCSASLDTRSMAVCVHKEKCLRKILIS